jgi:hypothetical protein
MPECFYFASILVMHLVGDDSHVLGVAVIDGCLNNGTTIYNSNNNNEMQRTRPTDQDLAISFASTSTSTFSFVLQTLTLSLALLLLGKNEMTFNATRTHKS